MDEFWSTFLNTNEWPIARVPHSQYSKKAVCSALQILGGQIAFELEDHAKGNRYALSILGVLLTTNGDAYRRLLVSYLEYIRSLYHSQPEKMQVTSSEASHALQLDIDNTKLLGRLLQLTPLHWSGGNAEQWTARIVDEVEDFPEQGSLDAELELLLLAKYTPSEPVFVTERRSKIAVQALPWDWPGSSPGQAQSSSVDPLKKKYQVFVSSTYIDLQTARQHVMQALLETKCIPTGMELFPAASTEQWGLIKRMIDECDYYIVVVAGRYGSVDENGLGYTEKEYNYAIEAGKPIIGFFHQDICEISGRNQESTDDAREKLAVFTTKIKNKLCRGWSTPAELGSAVKSAILNELEFNPRPGWIRADAIPLSEPVEKLKQRIADLEEQLKTTHTV